MGQAFYKSELVRLPGGGGFAVAFGGEKSPIGDSQYGSPPGRSFYSCKRNQNTLGALPQDPCRWLCWIRIDLRREPKINPYCAQNRSQGSRRRICPYRLAVPEKIFALFVRSIFSTATDSPPRFIRHRRRSAPNPHPPRSRFIIVSIRLTAGQVF